MLLRCLWVHLREAMKNAPPESSGAACAARLCSASHRPHVYPRVPSWLPLQLPHTCGPHCPRHPSRT